MINYSFVRVVCAPLLHNESQWRLTKNAEQRVDSRKRLAKAKRFTVASIRRVCPSTSPFLSLSAAECSMSYSDNQHIKVFRIAVLVSGSGRSLQNLCERIHADHLHGCEISLVIASKPSAGALQRAENFGVPTRVIKQKDFNGNIDAFSEAISHVLDEFRVDLVIMAGWMHFYQIPARYDGRVINIHPSLIPSFCGKGFYGNRVHEAVVSDHLCLLTVHAVDILTTDCSCFRILRSSSVPRLVVVLSI